MTAQQLQQDAIAKGYALNIPSDANLITAADIAKYSGTSTQTPKQILAEIYAHPFGRSQQWGLGDIVNMYMTALENGASYGQVDASANENYGMSFGTIFSLYLYYLANVA